jgi:hypothetical protein
MWLGFSKQGILSELLWRNLLESVILEGREADGKITLR